MKKIDEKELSLRLEKQKQEILKVFDPNIDDACSFIEYIEGMVFSENDIVELYLEELGISEEDVILEDLRDLQHIMINDIKCQLDLY